LSRTTFRREIGPKSEMQIKLIDRLRSRLTSSYDMTEGTDRLRNTGCIECYLQLIFRRVLDISDAVSILWPLLKNEWVEMGDPAPPRRRTHGGTGAGVLALVKPLPPKAVAGRPGFTSAKRPRLRSPPADRWAAVQSHALPPSLLPRATSPIRNSIEPDFGSVMVTLCQGGGPSEMKRK